jgi:hypothetical protein
VLEKRGKHGVGYQIFRGDLINCGLDIVLDVVDLQNVSILLSLRLQLPVFDRGDVSFD